ncbi:MAG: ribonuclease Z [Bacteroidota bacterium]
MPFEVTILGSSSATPTPDRHPTAQVLNVRERFFLLDCGEGTQMQMMKYKIRHGKINHVFITHLHGDHYLGLMGLLYTMHLQGRTAELHVFGQQELMDIIEMQLRFSRSQLRYPLIFHPIKNYSGDIIHEDDDLVVRTLVMNHRIPCTGFHFQEKLGLRRINTDKLKQYAIPVHQLDSIKRGADFTDGMGRVVPNKELTFDPAPPRSYAYFSDTLFEEDLASDVEGTDLIYHEATFLHDDIERARATYHSTALQAAMLAKKANAGRLIIGHFSARYPNLEPLLHEARSIFPETDLAIEGSRFAIEHGTKQVVKMV